MPTPAVIPAHAPHPAADAQRRPRVVLVASPEAIAAACAFLSEADILAVAPLGRTARRIHAERVIDDIASLPRVCVELRPDAAVLCAGEADREAAARVRTALEAAGVPTRLLPTPSEAITPPASSRRREDHALSDVDASALIGRPARRIGPAEAARARRALHAKRVLITGAGGSIGSELARQAAALEPELLILMDRSENAVFEIDRQIAERFPHVPRRSMLHDVVDEHTTLNWLLELRPHAVFHAAAHKHVTVMEDHPAHAVNNNLFGTKSIADAALAAGVERFVMISTDKAVNPRSVMGATKRFAELYVGSRNARAAASNAGALRTRFSMVRFGNVLGSACSVIPIWTRQMAEGGPLTVTHPEMTRYFMTIPEAAQLVVQAGALDPAEAAGADVFVLDMGEPVRIVELAERLVRAAGLSPVFPEDRADPRATAPAAGSMPIVFTGPRPGEKLHEELAHASEELRPTPAPGVLAWASDAARGLDPAGVERLVADLAAVRWSVNKDAVLRAVARHAPGVSRRDGDKPISDKHLQTGDGAGSLHAA